MKNFSLPSKAFHNLVSSFFIPYLLLDLATCIYGLQGAENPL
jgi:hypothetical protein